MYSSSAMRRRRPFLDGHGGRRGVGTLAPGVCLVGGSFRGFHHGVLIGRSRGDMSRRDSQRSDPWRTV